MSRKSPELSRTGIGCTTLVSQSERNSSSRAKLLMSGSLAGSDEALLRDAANEFRQED